MILSIDWIVSAVWIVEITRCPVSAAFTAVCIVSRSRISPITITSGLSLTTLRNASAKLYVSVPTSRCEITLFKSLCMNSMGSSILTTCRA